MRRRIQLTLWILVPLTIVAGFWYPLFGFVAPVVMITGIVGGFTNGRFVCGWLCPRGAFFDRIMPTVSPKKDIPKFFRTPLFRWTAVILLMGFMVLQLAQNPTDVYHWGTVFVRICLITTLLGVALATFYHPRTWCSFCPMGTLQSTAGGRKSPLYMDDGCIGCGACEKACPMNLKIVDNIENGKLNDRDCLKCPECQTACPKDILHF